MKSFIVFQVVLCFDANLRLKSFSFFGDQLAKTVFWLTLPD